MVCRFQSTRPRRARRNTAPQAGRHGRFQSTRPRRARPTRSVISCILSRFQSTRPRRARRVKERSPRTISSFNPRAHAGRDRRRNNRCDGDGAFQSTRPRRARPKVVVNLTVPYLFQSTRPRRARRCSMCYRGGPSMFQSTRPRRARPCIFVGFPACHGFNPRAHAGRDRMYQHHFHPKPVSIHAPTQGATE